ncbi:MAG: ParB/RepB/Spo0J family partition protein [Methylacidiphilales bacterium]|nr:ParB/RepB/Spo0J family partition protein [Candidatus Methylacidiphilales bacterium]NJR15234.1 ParB/RepB/Spo0J family partition protein [Calothrix sp. CSU_2_0]
MNIILHKVNDLQIGQRHEDGYINLTKMAQASNKKLNDYLRLSTAKAFIEKLSTDTGIPVSGKNGLVQVHKGGNNKVAQGTWGHPQVAINCGQWCSPEFAVLVSKWVFNWITTAQNSVKESFDSSNQFSDVVKAYIESSQALNRVIHTAIHQQTDSLREALKFLDTENHVIINCLEAESKRIEQISHVTHTICIDLIQLPPSQPRRYFDPQKLEELSHSIKELGILEPLLVRPVTGGNYELVAGERRYKAAQLAGLTEVPVVIREMDDVTTSKVKIVENLQREDLNPIEETEGILELLALQLEWDRNEVTSQLNKMRNVCDRYGEDSEVRHNVMSQSETKTIKELFASLGRMSWESFVKNRLPLLNLPQDVMEVLRDGKLEYTKARAIAGVKDEQKRKEILEDALAYNLSLNDIKRKIKEIEQQVKPESLSIKDQVDNTFRKLKQSKVWEDPKKKVKVEKLLAQLDALMVDDVS